MALNFFFWALMTFNFLVNILTSFAFFTDMFAFNFKMCKELVIVINNFLTFFNAALNFLLSLDIFLRLNLDKFNPKDHHNGLDNLSNL
jgi:hypothetical protein